MYYDHCIKTELDPQDYQPHYHTRYEMLFLKEGRVSYLIGNKVFSLRKNTLVFSRPNYLHCIRIDGDAPYDRYDLLLSDTLLAEAILVKIPDTV
ncbi:MAG: AraC family ligand binding domain-containing protein [Peptococcaceae bacterium]|nr:AraC family ligand binding domain-containing protein [Peptococcaceae bacterium]